ncbi:MAG: Mth938-like domain-containing protein [Chromatiales bacterium]|jgi:uncharacterized protein|nr:Mth938-like domain-containing protein [Chromatiales bacterium]
MQINRDTDTASHNILSYGEGEITVIIPRRFDARTVDETQATQAVPALRREIVRSSLLIMPEMLRTDWPPQDWDALLPEHFDLIAPYEPEVVLLGTGVRLRHPSPRLYAGLTRLGVGVEVMDTGSACRTYNFLMTDRRRVLAALLMITPAGA